MQEPETLDIFMNRTDGSAQAADPPKNVREAEVFENPSGGPAVVLIEDMPEDDQYRQPIPPRKFAPPPLRPKAPASSSQQSSEHVYEEKKVLPETDLLQLADLELLANPEKMAPKKKESPNKGGDKKKDASSASASANMVVGEDKPVPPRFPPPPSASNLAPSAPKPIATKSKPETSSRRSVKDVKSTVKDTTDAQPQPLKPALKKPSPSPAPAHSTPYSENPSRGKRQPVQDYEVVENQPEFYSSNPRRSHYFRNPYEDQNDSNARSRQSPEYHYDVNEQRYVDAPERRRGDRDRNDRNDRDRNDRNDRDRNDRNERRRRYDDRNDDQYADKDYYDDRPRGREDRRRRDYEEDERDQRRNRRMDDNDGYNDAMNRPDNNGGFFGDGSGPGGDSGEASSNPVRQPAVPPEELRRRREEEEIKEKQQLLLMLYQFEKRGCHISQSFSMESSIEELRFEVQKIKNERSAKTSVKWYKVFLMIVTTAVEELNTRFDPFGLRLKKWSKKMHETKDELDDCFYRLHDKYSAKASIEPEMELFFAFFGGMFMYHLENAADGVGEIGKIVSHVTGGSGSKEKEKTDTQKRKVNTSSFTAAAGNGNIPPGAYAQQQTPMVQTTGTTGQMGQQFFTNQNGIVTNMPIFQQQTQPFQGQNQQFQGQNQQFQGQNQQFQGQNQQFQGQTPYYGQQQQPFNNFAPQQQQAPLSQPWNPNVSMQNQVPQQPGADQQEERRGPSGRRIMRAPAIPQSASMGLETITAAMQNDDIPIDMTNVEIPISVGGGGVGGASRPQTGSATTSSAVAPPAAPKPQKPASKGGRSGASKAPRSSAPAGSRSIQI
jgi:hypothetical protein